MFFLRTNFFNNNFFNNKVNKVIIQSSEHKGSNMDQKAKTEKNKGGIYISKDEAKKRQLKLNEAGINVKTDGIWGIESEKKWNEYLTELVLYFLLLESFYISIFIFYL